MKRLLFLLPAVLLLTWCSLSNSSTVEQTTGDIITGQEIVATGEVETVVTDVTTLDETGTILDDSGVTAN